jgi:hypothetical protein
MTRTQQPSDVQTFVNRVIDQSPSLQLMFAEMEADRRRRMQDAAKADPKANRATTVFDAGVPPSYRYYPTKTKPEVRFCWTVHRNAAGRFLIFRERYNARRRTISRDQVEAILDKRAAIHACKLNRDEVDAKRAKARAKRALNGQAVQP